MAGSAALAVAEAPDWIADKVGSGFEMAGEKGAAIMNIIPLIPQADFAHWRRPSHERVFSMRQECGKYILQMTHCRQCRADAFGVLGEDRDMELEMLNAKIGDDYCEMVL